MCLLLVQHSLFCKTSQVLFSIHMVELRDDLRIFIHPSWLNQGQSQNVHRENPSVLQSRTLESSGMLLGLLLHCRKGSVLPLCSWVVVAHTGEERDLNQGEQYQSSLSSFWMLWSYKDVYI